jgi:uncharacterized membrane protein HdeD (DUF308 family)
MVDVEHAPFLAFPPRTIADHWRLYLAEGIVLLLLGIGAILVPVFASFAVAIFLGWLFLVGGLFGAMTALAGRHAPGFWWSLLSSLVTIVAGLLMIGWPVVGAISVTLVLAAYLVADGIISILFAVEHRRQLTRRWGWLLANGIIDLVLAALIFAFLPFAAIWALGLFVGIDFIFGGSSLIAMALAARQH